MPIYSDAARAFARENFPPDSPSSYSAAFGFDAGYTEALAAQPTPAPRIELDVDDPRRRPGAKVRAELPDGTAVEGILTGPAGQPWEGVGGQTFSLNLHHVGATLYLLTEAPDPDADILAAMRATEGDTAADALASLRSRGFDIVKAPWL